MPKFAPEYTYTNADFEKGLVKIPRQKLNALRPLHGTSVLPEGHSVIKVSNVRLHAPTETIESLHSMVMSSKTDNSKATSDKQTPKMKAQKKKDAFMARDAVAVREIARQPRNDAN